jgi:hypothetical protein
MASYPYSETFIVNAQAVNGAVVTAYKEESTLGGVPQSYNSVPPNAPDAGPVTTGPSFGAPGAFIIEFPTFEPYWVCIAWEGSYNWAYAPRSRGASNLLSNTATMVSFTPSGITQGAQVLWAAVS